MSGRKYDPDQYRRVIRAMDTNRVLCATCNVTMSQFYRSKREAAEEDKTPGWDGLRLTICRNPTTAECQGAMSVMELLHGVRAGRKRLKRFLAERQVVKNPDAASNNLSPELLEAITGIRSRVQKTVREEVEEARSIIDDLGTAWTDVCDDIRGELDLPGIPRIAQYYVHLLEMEMLKRQVVREGRGSPTDLKLTLDALNEIVLEDADKIEERHATGRGGA
jgi:hypothetical protein